LRSKNIKRSEFLLAGISLSCDIHKLIDMIGGLINGNFLYHVICKMSFKCDTCVRTFSRRQACVNHQKQHEQQIQEDIYSTLQYDYNYLKYLESDYSYLNVDADNETESSEHEIMVGFRLCYNALILCILTKYKYRISIQS